MLTVSQIFILACKIVIKMLIENKCGNLVYLVHFVLRMEYREAGSSQSVQKT